MSHPFEQHLAEIRETLLLMSSLADRNLSLAVRALGERNSALADTVEADDSEIDRLEVIIDEMIITYMATHAPVARDSRLMLGASKISANLERIGDEATTIARRSRLLNLEPELAPLTDIPEMANCTQKMLHDSITAFVEGKYEMAQAVIPADKEVDALHRRVAKDLVQLMMENSDNVQRAVNLLMVSKALERAGDHAQNIAEEVFYLFSGQDIRHDHGGQGRAA